MEPRIIRTPGVEFRQDDGGVGVVSGPVVNYGDVARTRNGPEQIHPGAFLGLTDPALPVNIQHRQQAAQRIATVADGLLTFRETPGALYADLRLPDTPAGRAAAAGVADGSLTGWSSEFVPLMETVENGVNTVYRALAVGLGLVDVPAYTNSRVEVRQASERSVLISGPAGAGKTARAQELREQTPRSIVADFQAIYAAILGLRRDPQTGRYPERQTDDAYALALAEGMRVSLISMAQRDGVAAIVTNSVGDVARRQRLLTLIGDGAREEVLDPGRATVERRLAGPDGSLSDQCLEAVDRWYGPQFRVAAPSANRRLAWL